MFPTILFILKAIVLLNYHIFKIGISKYIC